MQGQYMCFVFILKAWFLAASTNLWTSGMYYESSLNKLYIQKDRSIMSYGKISKLIDLNAKQVWNIVLEYCYLTFQTTTCEDENLPLVYLSNL